MLARIHLQNIAIVERADVTFEPGFTVITGETGSGKSVMIESIALAFGQKVSPKEILRYGTERGLVELLFTGLPTLPALLIEQLGLEGSPSELLLTREFSAATSRYRVEGVPVTADIVQQLRPFLVDLHGQHELTSLFQPEQHRRLLDCLGDETFQQLKQQYKQLYGEWREVRNAIDRLEAEKAEVLRQRDFYQFQFAELQAAELTDADEDTRLRQQLGMLKQAEQLATLCQQTESTLLSNSDGDSIVEALEALDQLYRRQAATGDEAFDGFHETLAASISQLRELADSVIRHGEALILPPEQLDAAVERLDVLEKVRRKYGPTLEAAITERDRLGKWLQQADDTSDEVELLKLKAHKQQGQLTTWAEQLSSQRQTLAAQLTQGIQGQLAELALPAATFEVQVQPLAQPNGELQLSDHGADRVQFAFSANPGEPVRALQQVASGGELSRVLLALKVLVAHHARVPTLVFDEIDTGISGPTARAVAAKLQRMASNGIQVLCITHQPLVAAAGQHHWHVEKELRADGVTVHFTNLDGNENERQRLIMRLTTGLDVADDALMASFSSHLTVAS